MPIVNVGDVVTTQWADWKKPHQVKISEIGVHLISKPQWTMQGHSIGIELYYTAQRLDKAGKSKEIAGSGIALSSFLTSNGETWKRKYDDFNHCGLSWKIKAGGKKNNMEPNFTKHNKQRESFVNQNDTRLQ